MGRLAMVLVLWLAGAPGLTMEPDDLHAVRYAGISDLSPDGRLLLYTITTYDQQEDRNRSTLLRRDLASGEEIVLFGPEEGATGAVWRPDGQAIAYVQSGDEGAAVWLMDPRGENRRQVSREPHAYGGLKWSPDGSALAYIATTPVGEYEGNAAVIVAEFIGYRHLGDGYRRGELGQLFVLELDSGQPRRLVDAPLDVRSFAWAPDSGRLVFAAKRREDLGVNLNTDLWIAFRNGDQPRQLTFNPGPDRSPFWGAGEWITYLRHTEPLNEAAPQHIATLTHLGPGDRGPLTLSQTGFDNRIWQIAAGGKYFLAFVAGCIDLFDEDGPLTYGGHDFWDVRVAGGRAVLQGAAQTVPSAIFQLELGEDGAGSLQLILDPNRDWYREAGLVEPVPFAVEVDDRTIHGWYFLPDSPEKGPFPTVLSIHGGPEWMYGGYFLPEFHVLPGRGYAVLIANPTGSTGYGLEFQYAIRGDWVGRPAEDLLACVDWAVAQGWADSERLAVMGGSYGGHLAAALTTQTDRFDAAAVDRMTCDLVSMWGSTDEKWFPEWEFLGRPWEERAREVYFRNSPTNFLDRVTTPTLISHGMLDYRCLISQAEFWFSGLKAAGVPVRFLRFENEGHGIRNRANQVFYLEELLAWFGRYLGEGNE